MVITSVQVTLKEAGETVWVTPLNLPTDKDLVFTSYLWELLDVATGMPMDFSDPEGVYVHHSAVHPLKDSDARNPVKSIMSKAMHIPGVTDNYNFQQDVPEGYGIFHLRHEDPWWMCCHVMDSPYPGPVVQRLTLYYHERRPEDRRAMLEKVGIPHPPHVFGLVPWERREFIAKLPVKHFKTVGVVYHVHDSVAEVAIVNPQDGEVVHELRVDALPEYGSVIQVPTAVFDEPVDWLDNQFFYFRTLVHWGASSEVERRGHGPMQIAMLWNTYDDQDFMPYAYYFLNPIHDGPIGCQLSFRGLQQVMNACEPIKREWTSIEGEYLVPVNHAPWPALRACETEEEDSCFREQMDLP